MELGTNMDQGVCQQYGGMYRVLWRWNMSGVVGQRYSIREKGRWRCPLTDGAMADLVVEVPR